MKATFKGDGGWSLGVKSLANSVVIEIGLPPGIAAALGPNDAFVSVDSDTALAFAAVVVQTARKVTR